MTIECALGIGPNRLSTQEKRLLMAALNPFEKRLSNRVELEQLANKELLPNSPPIEQMSGLGEDFTEGQILREHLERIGDE